MGDKSGNADSSTGCGEAPPAGVKYMGDSVKSMELEDGSGMTLDLGGDIASLRKIWALSNTGAVDGVFGGDGGGDGKGSDSVSTLPAEILLVTIVGTGGGGGSIFRRSFGRFRISDIVDLTSDMVDLLRPNFVSGVVLLIIGALAFMPSSFCGCRVDGSVLSEKDRLLVKPVMWTASPLVLSEVAFGLANKFAAVRFKRDSRFDFPTEGDLEDDFPSPSGRKFKLSKEPNAGLERREDPFFPRELPGLSPFCASD